MVFGPAEHRKGRTVIDSRQERRLKATLDLGKSRWPGTRAPYISSRKDLLDLGRSWDVPRANEIICRCVVCDSDPCLKDISTAE
jgi:hypothetical protein